MKKAFNETVIIFDIIRRPVFYLQHNLSEIGFCLRLQVEPIQRGPINIASLCLRTEINSVH
jgi:hypothetical protein